MRHTLELLAKKYPSMRFLIFQRETHVYFSGSTCADENGTKLKEDDDINSYKDVGQTRIILYGGGNAKIEYSNVKAVYWKKPYFQWMEDQF